MLDIKINLMQYKPYLDLLKATASPTALGIIYAQKGELPTEVVYEKDGEQAEFLEAYEQELAAIAKVAKLLGVVGKAMTVEEALEHAADCGDYQLDVEWMRGGC